MRFAVATAILSHSSLHAASFEGKRSLGKFFSHARGENFEALLKKKPSPLGTRQQKRTSQHQRRVAALKKKLQGKLERPLKNRREAKEVVECDPNALDLGVLACGSDQFCVKNRSSSKGGVCSSRRLDEDTEYEDDGIYYDDDENYPDCTYDYDYETYTETRTCIYTACDEGGPCCYEYGYTSVLTPYAVESFTLFGNITEPYAQTLSVTLESTGCTAVIGGETCLSCTFDGVFYGLCFSFDCSNVIEGHTYDSCSEGEFILPVLETCEVSEEDDEAPIESESPTESPEAPIEIPTESPTPLESPTEGPVTSAAHLKSAASLVGFAAALVLYFGT